MHTAELGLVGTILIVAYLVAVVALGLWMSRGVKSTRDFFLAGRSLFNSEFFRVLAER